MFTKIFSVLLVAVVSLPLSLSSPANASSTLESPYYFWGMGFCTWNPSINNFICIPQQTAPRAPLVPTTPVPNSGTPETSTYSYSLVPKKMWDPAKQQQQYSF